MYGGYEGLVPGTVGGCSPGNLLDVGRFAGISRCLLGMGCV